MHRFCRSLSLLLLALSAACADGAGRDEPTFARVTDDAGREVRLAAPPKRIVSLIPATTETLAALGATDYLVARTDYDHDPRLAHLPSVGPGLTPSVEWLLSLHPDLVIAWPDSRDRSVAGQLAALGIPVYGARIETLEDVASTIRRLGALLGEGARADSLVAAIEGELASVRRAVAGRPRPRIFYVVGHEPPMTAGPGTFLDELVTIAGGENLFADAPAGWPMVSLEEIVRREPDRLIVPQGEGNALPARLATRPGWRELAAVRAGRIDAIDAEVAHRPGPRVGQVARMLAELIHPELFGGDTIRPSPSRMSGAPVVAAPLEERP